MKTLSLQSNRSNQDDKTESELLVGPIEARGKRPAQPAKPTSPGAVNSLVPKEELEELYAGDIAVAAFNSRTLPIDVATERVINRSYATSWPLVDEVLPDEPGPAVLALYYMLGWTQCTSTWEWPGTDKWVELFTKEPPDHWCPRVQWHLCWLTYDPQDEEHREGLKAALAEGREDDELGVFAQVMELFMDLESLPERPAVGSDEDADEG